MMMKFKHCEACGMPMLHDKDFGGSDEKNTWCVNCCDENGNHKSYDEILSSMSEFLLTEEGFELSEQRYENIEESTKAAKEYLSKMPAFRVE